MITINVTSILIFMAKTCITLIVVGIAMTIAGDLGFNMSSSDRWVNFWEGFRDISGIIALCTFTALIIGVVAIVVVMLLWVMWTKWV